MKVGIKVNNKKIVVLGGGNGLSTVLSGLKRFPLDITAVVTMADDGSSTGKLRKEFNIPAPGDVRRVLIALAEKETTFEKIFNYRFKKGGTLNGHTVGNLILTAMTEMQGTMSEAVEELSKVFNIKGTVLPLTEQSSNTLVAELEDGQKIVGEHHITTRKNKNKIKRMFYLNNPEVNHLVIKALKEADLIILSVGSLYTSVIPNIIPKEIGQAIDKSNGKLMSVVNMMIQPGETDGFTASDHIKELNKYLGKKKIEVAIINKEFIPDTIVKKYETLEQKSPVIIDEELENLGIEIIKEDLVDIVNDQIRTDTLQLAFAIYSYLIKKEGRKKISEY